MKKLFISMIVLFSLGGIFYTFTYAHPGMTDDFGCHTCTTNCTSWSLFYEQYHCHPELIIKPSSYYKYAPAGSCGQEKQSVLDDEAKLTEIELSIANVKNDLQIQYGSLPKSLFNSMLTDTTNKLIQQYNSLYSLYTAHFNARKLCLEEAGYKNFLKIKAEEYLKAQKIAESLSSTTINKATSVTTGTITPTPKNYYKAKTCNKTTSIKNKDGNCYCKT